MLSQSSLLPLLALTITVTAASCAADLGGDGPNCDDGQCDHSSRRTDHATRIRDAAAAKGMTNAVLLAGIGQVETNLTHCWDEAKWACKGPASESCNGGPVISGSADGACSLKQGGLGMFQFDAGTHSDTLAKYGPDIVTLEGNVHEVMPFLLVRAVESVPGIGSQEEALEWMNSIKVQDGDPEFEKWLRFISWRYNGCKDCTSQENKYRNGTHIVANEMGSDFWGSIGEGGKDPDFTPGDNFVGSDCAGDPDSCSFSFDGEDAECIEWFDQNDSELHGYCSVSCEGYCPDQAGSAPTFCADIPGEVGMCASRPSSENSFCDDVPGTLMQAVPRHVGNSGVDQIWLAACVPPGNATGCDSGGLGGECIDTNSMTCGGSLHTGLCPGGSNVRCCTR